MDEHSDSFISHILQDVKTIALVGVSSNKQKDSYKVMKFLLENNYEVYPVNPNEKGNSILGQYCYGDLKSIGFPIDMVEIFRKSEEVLGIAKEAINIGSKVLWTQLGIIDKEAFKMAKNKGLKVVMNRCPKIELKKIEIYLES